MFGWIRKIFQQEEKKKPAPISEIWPGFIVGIYDHVKPKRSYLPSRRPKGLRERELSYNIADDVFFVGIGNGKYKMYRKSEQ